MAGEVVAGRSGTGEVEGVIGDDRHEEEVRIDSEGRQTW